MHQRGGPGAPIGMPSIKASRLKRSLQCQPGDFVGQYVPFYFCPRSVMLFIIYKGNQAGLNYRGGQGPIVHLQADLYDVVAWANSKSVRWAFTDSNAATSYFESWNNLNKLNEINWQAVAANNWRNRDIQEGKQAEFLVREFFPWKLVTRVGVRSADIQAQATTAIQFAQHRPNVAILPAWYY